MDLCDPIERLAALNPEPGPAERPDGSLLAALIERAHAEDERHRRRRRRRRLGAAVFAAASLSATAAAAWVVSQHADDPDTVTCYEAPSLEATRVATTDRRGDPIASCIEQAWGPGKPFHEPGTAAPPLQACLSRERTAAVFPSSGGDTCVQLGLVPLEPGLRPDDDPGSLGLPGRVSGIFLDACLDAGEAEAAVRAELRRSGLAHWHVEHVRAASADEPCLAAAVDVPDQTVYLVPIPDITD